MEGRANWNEIQTRLIARAWKDEGFKQELLSDPKGVLERELGTELPEDVRVQVLEQPRNTLYLVLPESPALTEAELSEEELEAAAGGRYDDSAVDYRSCSGACCINRTQSWQGSTA